MNTHMHKYWYERGLKDAQLGARGGPGNFCDAEQIEAYMTGFWRGAFDMGKEAVQQGLISHPSR